MYGFAMYATPLSLRFRWPVATRSLTRYLSPNPAIEIIIGILLPLIGIGVIWVLAGVHSSGSDNTAARLAVFDTAMSHWLAAAENRSNTIDLRLRNLRNFALHDPAVLTDEQCAEYMRLRSMLLPPLD